MYEEAKNAKCVECGGPVGLGKDGKPYKRCFNCIQKEKKAEASKPEPQKLPASQGRKEPDKESIIIREAAIKSASEAGAGKSAKEIIKMAQEFEKYINGEAE